MRNSASASGEAVGLHEKLSVLGVGQREVLIHRDGFFVCLFRFIAFVLDSVKTGETEVRLNALRIQLDGAIQLGQRLVLFALAGQDAGHQDVAFDVVRIEIERFLRQAFRFGGEFRAGLCWRRDSSWRA